MKYRSVPPTRPECWAPEFTLPGKLTTRLLKRRPKSAFCFVALSYTSTWGFLHFVRCKTNTHVTKSYLGGSDCTATNLNAATTGKSSCVRLCPTSITHSRLCVSLSLVASSLLSLCLCFSDLYLGADKALRTAKRHGTVAC